MSLVRVRVIKQREMCMIAVIYRVSQKSELFVKRDRTFFYRVRTHIKYLNQADQIFRSLFSNVNKHPNIS